jgi:hypothetical protein
MKFVTKKAKLIILGIIFIGAVLLAYNSLHNNLAYLDLKHHLGGSSFEGFENSSGNEDDYNNRHSSDYPKNTKKDSQYEDCDKNSSDDKYSNDKYSSDKYSSDKKDKKNKKDDSSYKNSSSYDKFSSTMSSYANSATSTVDDIINDFDGSSSRDKDYKVNNGSGLDSKKKKKSCDESKKRDHRRDGGGGGGYNDDRYNGGGGGYGGGGGGGYGGGGGGGYGGYSGGGRSGYEYSGDNGAGYNAARYNGSGSSSNQNNSTKNKDKAKSQIPAGSEDLYILKSEIVPPVCPVCPSVTACPNEPVPPCPPCGRCPESSFECKKVPNYGNNQSSFMPMPVLNDFSTFGM